MPDVAQSHDQLRPLMFSVAYRMLGSVAEAEDVVQDAFIRIHKSGTKMQSPEAFATTVTTRLAIDALRSARLRRELYVGSWLPEPLLADDPDPAHRIEMDETVSVAFLVLLERLSPVERAVFVLREVFAYDFAQVAAVVERTEANCRQLLVRARKHIDDKQPRFDESESRKAELADAFFAALRGQGLENLEQLLSEDVIFYGDGGGKAPAIKRPIRGREEVARFLRGLVRQGERFQVDAVRVEANGQPAIRLLGPDGALLSVLGIDITADGSITAVRNQLNPLKLQHLGPVGDMTALLQSSS